MGGGAGRLSLLRSRELGRSRDQLKAYYTHPKENKMKKEDLKKALGCEENITAALLFLFQRQTEEEKTTWMTRNNNGVGFNSADAPFLSSLVDWYQRKGYLTEKQRSAAARCLLKYWAQIPEHVLSSTPSDNSRAHAAKAKPAQNKKPASAQEEEAPKKKAVINGGIIELSFPYDKDMVQKVRELPQRRWIPDRKIWTVPVQEGVLEKIKALGFSVEGETDAQKMVQDVKKAIEDASKIALMPYQKEGVQFIEEHGGRALVADEMGLGKTSQALVWLGVRKDARPAVIVVPAAVKINWLREAQKFMTRADEERFFIAQGIKPVEIPKHSTIVIINYDILSYWTHQIQKSKPKALILDEIHYIKNKSALRTKAVKEIAKDVPHVIGLSGTPIVNRPAEFYTPLNIIRPGIVGKWWNFALRYCDAKHNGFGWDFSGASNTEELHQKLTQTVMIRRRKEDVLQDLPKKTRAVVPMELDPATAREYHRAETDFKNWLRANEKDLSALNAEALAQIGYLRQIAVRGKIRMATAWIKDALDANGKIVVFAVHKETIKTLMEELKDYNPVKLDGSTPPNKRQEVVDRFQNDDSCRVFIGNIRAAGVGITLTAASAVVFVELAWTPGEHDQAEDRIHRIGQELPVTAYYLIAESTVEEKLVALIDQKRQVLDSVLDGKETDESSMLSELLRKYEEESK